MTVTPRQPGTSPAGAFDTDDMPRSFIGDVMALITHPVEFFSVLNAKTVSRTLLIGLLILGIVGIHALRTAPTNDTVTVSVDMPLDGMPFDPGIPPPDMGGTPSPATGDASAKWMTALSAIGETVVTWFVLALLLSEVTMFNGRRPQLGLNMRVVVWSSVPLALMALLQVVYVAGGGTLAGAGFSGFLDEWAWFNEQNLYLRSFIHALASHLTLFWLWSLYLLYVGGRWTLRGKRAVVLMVVGLWIMIIGVAYGPQSYEILNVETEPSGEVLSDDMMPEGEILSDDDSMLMDSEAHIDMPIEDAEAIEEGGE